MKQFIASNITNNKNNGSSLIDDTSTWSNDGITSDCKHSFVCNITRADQSRGGGGGDMVLQRECVPFSKRCNGIKDCTNGRDEKNCSSTIVAAAESTLGTSRFIEFGSHEFTYYIVLSTTF